MPSDRSAVLPFVDVFRDLAEGRWNPEEWLQWWDAHAGDVEAACPRGWFLRLKPPIGGNRGVGCRTASSQNGVCYVLDKLQIPYTRSARYQEAAEAEFREFSARQEAARAARSKEYGPLLKALKKEFPRFARFLEKNISQVDELRPGATEAELMELESSLGVKLPMAYRRFLRCVRGVSYRDTLQVSSVHPFVHESNVGRLPTEGMLCIAEFWLEGDGDQVLFDLRGEATDDPPVFYYAHAAPPEVRKLADSFTAWVESLPKRLRE